MKSSTMFLDKSPEAVPIIPEQSVFDTRVFSEKKRTPMNKPRCPSPPLKTPPVSRLFTTPRYTPANNYTLSVIKSRTKDSHSSSGPIPFALNFASEQPASRHTPNQQLAFGSVGPEPHLSHFERRFRHLGEIGSGGFGHVLKAQSVVDGLIYAIKRSRHQFRGLYDRERSLDEVRYASQLPQHPHIIHYIDAWEEGGFLFIQTELCELGTLKDFLERLSAPVVEDQIWAFLADMVLGITHMHKHNLMHLDIKPANVFLTSEGHLKIGDFGLVQQRGGYDHDVEGDCRYMAPELLLEDKTSVSFPADIFCVGATAFEMAANVEMPSNGESWRALRSGHASSHIPPQRSPELRSLIGQLMEPVPDKRPTADQILSHPRIQHILQQRASIPNTPIYSSNITYTSPHYYHNQTPGMTPTPAKNHLPPSSAPFTGSRSLPPSAFSSSTTSPIPLPALSSPSSPRGVFSSSTSPHSPSKDPSLDISSDLYADEAYDEDLSSFSDDDDLPSNMRPLPSGKNTLLVRDLETKQREVLRRESLESATKYASATNTLPGHLLQTPAVSRSVYEPSLLSTFSVVKGLQFEGDVPSEWREPVPAGVTPKKLIDMFNDMEDGMED
eukprot:TRINITY_DN9489_c0_g1_i2.p1 TRINITY_DN9489_c0_g1~~TRINITY_DN9489_c0_g1_i2.p1  ORF type:complete len:612 (-),score=46.17 TRINITY_DN9489_c0_g1_i2:10-1845(-)